MRKSALISLLVVLAFVALAALSSTNSSDSPKSSDLSWKSLENGSSIALQQKKKLLVDVYTDWCTWCKKMDKDVYPDPNVQRQLQSSFVAVKLNAESDNKQLFRGSSMSEREFARSAGVTGYPTILFFDENLKPITALPGYVTAETFTNILSYIGGDHYKTTSYQDYLRSLKDSK